MELEDLLSDDLLEWLQVDEPGFSGDLERLLATSDVTEQLADSTPSGPTLPACASAITSSTHPSTSSSLPCVRFAPPKTDAEIANERQKGIPKKTQEDTKYCLNIWVEWRKHRQQTTGDTIATLQEMTRDELQHWLTRFILEARKRDGSVYPPNTLHHICSGLMRHLRWTGKPQIDFFKDDEFADFRASLDAEMKRLQSQGIGSKKRQAEVLTEDEEELLWKKGLLGDATPQSLLDTIVFYNGLYFALRSGKEHRQLRRTPCQIELVERPGERPYLKYTEDVSKNHPGGLKGRKVAPKVVTHHANLDKQKRCFVRLFQRYRELCPEDAPPHAFYLQPSRTPTSSCWYSKCPLGHTTLGKTVARLCKSAGIEGYKTNHSLRATATSRLYQSGVDEQLVMERTGHRSLEGVRSYKRTSDAQREALSDILNGGTKKAKLDGTRSSHLAPAVPALLADTTPTFLSASQHSQQLRTFNLPSATFNHCTVNFYVGKPAAPHTETLPRRKRAMILDSDSD